MSLSMSEKPQSQTTAPLRAGQTVPSVASGVGMLQEAQDQKEVTFEVKEDELEGCIGNWRFLEKLGQGGMSVVYRAQHEWLHTDAAIKLLHSYAKEAGFTKAKERFYQEAYILSQFQHPNIISIQDFGVDEEHGVFMVLELLEGVELADLMKIAPLDLSWVRTIFLQMSEGLHTLHERQYIHRDLKPSNVFVSSTPDAISVKLLDFGVAKTLGDEEYKKLTTTGRIVGTPKYIAPEQLRTPDLVSPLTDLYSLGAILYEALTGTTPHSHPDIVEYLLLITQKAPPLLGVHRPELAGSLVEALVARLLSIDPFERVASARAFQEEFERALAALGVFGEDAEETHQLHDFLGKPVHKEQGRTPPRQISTWSSDKVSKPHSEGDEWLASTMSLKWGYRFVGFGAFCALLSAAVWFGIARFKPFQTKKNAVAPVVAKPSPLDQWAERGQVAFQAKKYGTAIQMWERVIAHEHWGKSKYHPKLFWATGVALLRLSKERKALELFVRYTAGVKKLRRSLLLLQTHTADEMAVKELRARLPDVSTFEKEQEKVLSLQTFLQSRQRRRMKSVQVLRQAFDEARAALGNGRTKQAKAKLSGLLRMARKKKFPKSSQVLVENLAAQAKGWHRQVDVMLALYQDLPRSLRRAQFRTFKASERKLEAMRQGQALPRNWQKNIQRWSRRAKRGMRLFSRAKNAYALSQWRAALHSYRLYAKRFPHTTQKLHLRKRLKACRCVVQKWPWEICRSADYPKHFKGKKE